MAKTQHNSAIEWNRDALVADRQTVARLGLLADALVERREFHEAENCFRQAAVLSEQLADSDETCCDLYVAFGLLLIRLKKFDEASNWLQKAEGLMQSGNVARESHSDVYEALAKLNRRTGHISLARQYTELAEGASSKGAAEAVRRLQQLAGTGGQRGAPLASSSQSELQEAPFDWSRILERTRINGWLPFPSEDELVCLAGVLQCAVEGNDEGIPPDRLRCVVSPLRPKWDGYEVRKVAEHAAGRGFLRVRVKERLQSPGRPEGATRSPDGSDLFTAVLFELASPPMEILAAVCHGALRADRLTDEMRRSIRDLTESLILDDAIRQSVFVWLNSV